MNTKSPLLAFFSLAALFSLNSCGHFFIKSKSYTASSALEINGAKVSGNVKPMGGSSGFQLSAMIYTAGSGTLDGPFIWRIEAEGQEGVHESLTVHRLKVTTEKTKRSEWYPSEHLNKPAEFKPLPKKESKTFAQFQIPGKLEVYPEKDGDFSVTADVSIKANGKSVRKTVRFDLATEIKRDVETLNIVSEIIGSFKENPEEWDW